MDSCPHCDADLPADRDDGGGFCRSCGWDVELMIAEARGEGTELPDELDDEEYARVLAREGLTPGGGVPWVGVAVVVGLVALALLARAL